MSDGEAAPAAPPPADPPAASPPPALDMKARLAQLAARKRAEAEAAAEDAGGDGRDDGGAARPPQKRARTPGSDAGADSEADSADEKARRKAEKARRKREAKAAAAALAAGLPVPAPGSADAAAPKKKKKKKQAPAPEPPRRPRREPKPAAEEPQARPPRPDGDDEGGSASEDEPDVAPRTAEDDAFIDDEGAEPAAGYYSDGGGDRGGSPTPSTGMEEDAEFEALFKGGKKGGGRRGRGGRGGLTSAELTAASDFLARMEAAAEDDLQAAKDGRPAVHRLRLAPAVEAQMASAKTQEWYLNNGVLGLLKTWLEPAKAAPKEGGRRGGDGGDGDGGGPLVLPPARVREAVLRALTTLNVDAADPDRRVQLVQSGVGKAVMLLSRVPGASPTETRLARALVTAWARPVWEKHRDVEGEDAARAARAEAALAARAARVAADAAAKQAAADAAAGLNPGDRGFRRRALPPTQARLDFVRQPDAGLGATTVAAGALFGGGGGGGGNAKTKVEKALDALAKRGRAGPARGSRVSVEGRGLE